MWLIPSLVVLFVVGWFGRGGWVMWIFRAPFFALLVFWLLFGL